MTENTDQTSTVIKVHKCPICGKFMLKKRSRFGDIGFKAFPYLHFFLSGPAGSPFLSFGYTDIIPSYDSLDG